MTSVERVAVTDEAAEFLRRLTGRHGQLMFHQSGGCCDGSSPMCYPSGEFLTGDADVQLADLIIEGWHSRCRFGCQSASSSTGNTLI